MNNKYNVMITYAGEGTFKFNLRKIGEVEISMTRPVYIYNADVDTINNLKFRASYGELGNQNIGNYPYQELLKLDYNYVFDNQAISSGAAPESLANQNILWERTSSWDFGVDMSLLDNKLSFVFDWYKKRTRDILRASQIPGSIGLNAPTVNDGEVTSSEMLTFFTSLLDNGAEGEQTRSELFDFAQKQAAGFYSKYSKEAVNTLNEFISDIKDYIS